MPLQQLQTAGAPVIDILALTTSEGDKIDLAPLLVNLVLYEDLFSPVLTGTITINDTIGLLNRLPLVGNEQLTVKIYSNIYSSKNPIDYLHRTFDINRITDIDSPNDYSKQYTIHFASPELRKSELIKISKGYQNTTISNVVSRIVTEEFELEDPAGLGLSQTSYNYTRQKSPFLTDDSIESWYKKEDDDDTIEFFVERTKHTEPYISFPYTKPFDLITWLSSRSLRHCVGRNGSKNTNEAANFVFFENTRGYQFTSIDTLMESRDYGTTTFRFGNTAQNTENDKNQRVIYFETIQDFQVQDCFNILSNVRNGMYASKLYSYDVLTGNLKTNEYNYDTEFYNTESLERGNDDFPLIAQDNNLTNKYLTSRIFSATQHLDVITSEDSQRYNVNKTLYGAEEYLQRRASQLSRLNNYKVLFKIHGNSKHRVGNVVTLDLKDWVSKKDSIKGFVEQDNKYYHGNYLITSIRHTITKFNYNMDIEAVRDSSKTQIG